MDLTRIIPYPRMVRHMGVWMVFAAFILAFIHPSVLWAFLTEVFLVITGTRAFLFPQYFSLVPFRWRRGRIQMRPLGYLGWIDISGPSNVSTYDDDSEIGRGVVIHAHTRGMCLGAHVILHDNVIIGRNAWYYEHVEIGPNIDLTGINRLNHIHWWRDLP